MPQRETKRVYTIADADLKQLADALLGSMNRDIAAFATRNITAAKLDEYSQLITNFDMASTDEEMLGLSMVVNESKEAIVTALRPLLRTIRSISDNAYNGKGYHHVFRWGAINDLSDNALCQFSKRVHRVATRLQAAMAEHGLTTALLNELSSLYDQLSKAIDECDKAEEERDLETQDRITKGNILYAEMMRLAGIGKSLFEDNDEARYNDYVLIGSHPSPPKNTTELAEKPAA